jgi:hypothetical protein
MDNKVTTITDNVLASLVTKGDISDLTPQHKAQYYSQLCQRVGLDPATTPFLPLKLNGKEILYATKGAAEQLRNVHKISLSIVARERIEDVYQVTARATAPDGRTDESVGAVTIAGLKGDALANALMKAETKSKRRVTLSIVGLGMLDESELEMVPANKFEQLQKTLPASAVERPKERKAEALPPVPDVITNVPAAILLASPRLSSAGLDGVEFKDMTLECLELLQDALEEMLDKSARGGRVSELGLSWIRALLIAVEMHMPAVIP